MGKQRKLACALAFLALVAAVRVFLVVFDQSGPVSDGLAWESAAVVGLGGGEDPFDPAAEPPALEEGEWYRLSARLPEDRPAGQRLSFSAAGMEIAVFLDGQEIWYSNTGRWEDSTAGGSQAALSLPAGGGEALVMDLRPDSGAAGALPSLRLVQPQGEGASFRRVPLEAPTRILILLGGLFLLSLARGAADWLLLLPMLTVLIRLAWQTATGDSAALLPPLLRAAFGGEWMNALAVLPMLLYLVLHRSRAFWRALGRTAAWTGGILLVVILLSVLHGGPMYRTFIAPAWQQLRGGDVGALIYWFTLWLLLQAVLLSVWRLARSIAQLHMQARALSLRNSLLMDNYHALERKVRESAAVRHESAHRLAAMDAMLKEGDLEGLERCLKAWKKSDSAASPILFTKNIAVNAILQDAAGRAQSAGIDFQAEVMVPQELPYPDEDLCALLMNLLDNALEGAERTPEGEARYIAVKMRTFNSFLVVRCDNTFDGRVEKDPRGNLLTTKDDASSHGFGMAQMRAVAEKYRSTLDVEYAGHLFTVRTALQRPRKR